MIKFRPNFRSVSASMKEEISFETTEEMIHYLFDRWSSVVHYMGAEPFRPEEITLGTSAFDDPQTGWRNVRPVTVSRIANAPGTICIGFCGE